MPLVITAVRKRGKHPQDLKGSSGLWRIPSYHQDFLRENSLNSKGSSVRGV